MKSLQHRVIRLDNAKWHGPARDLLAVNLVVLHATASGKAQTAMSVISYMNRDDHGPISYHYIVDRDGSIVRMTDPKFIAYHAGDSAWPGPKRALPKNQKPNGGKSVNSRSVGISFVNDNVKEPLTALQLESGEWLCRTWMRQLGVAPASVIAHKECAPGRKSDPILDMDAWRKRLARPETE